MEVLSGSGSTGVCKGAFGGVCPLKLFAYRLKSPSVEIRDLKIDPIEVVGFAFYSSRENYTKSQTLNPEPP